MNSKQRLEKIESRLREAERTLDRCEPGMPSSWLSNYVGDVGYLLSLSEQDRKKYDWPMSKNLMNPGGTS